MRQTEHETNQTFYMSVFQVRNNVGCCQGSETPVFSALGVSTQVSNCTHRFETLHTYRMEALDLM